MDVNVKDIVALVTDKSNERFGQLGRMKAHDWKESGTFLVEFADGGSQWFADGWCKGDPKSPVKCFYRNKDVRGFDFDDAGCGPVNLIREYARLGLGDETKLKENYRELFGEDF